MSASDLLVAVFFLAAVGWLGALVGKDSRRVKG